MVNIESQLKIKNNINALRKEKGLTQQALADAVNVTRATINAMERGAYNPSLELAFRLARFFKVDIQKIFFVED
ncbi:MAG: helix-turn-helix transcriptional regulator [Desulfobacteraceae bacterium]|jgi:putative transcriptional regulator